uniref:Uncharacterized protein n=1 Tax=Romanomermis culicivorax TaxID=13658 RepID=A0A915KLH9_ROMCU
MTVLNRFIGYLANRHDNPNCQQLCIGMNNNEPFSKILAYKHCLYSGAWAVVRIKRENNTVCVTTALMGGALVIFNDYKVCQNIAHQLPLDLLCDQLHDLASPLPHDLARHLPVDLSRHLAQRWPTV